MAGREEAKVGVSISLVIIFLMVPLSSIASHLVFSPSLS